MYYEINEELARQAHEMNSFRTFTPGAVTSDYKAAVDAVAALGEAQKKKVSVYYHGKIDGLVDSYSRRLAKWVNDNNKNRASCPSVMVCGPANFPTKKKNKQNAREDALMQEYEDIEKIKAKIKAVGTGPVDLADPHAREILEDQLQREQKLQADAKEINKFYRKHKTVIGCPVLSEASAAHLQKSLEEIQARCPFHDAPFPAYQLTGMRDKIKRLQARLAELDKREATPQEEQTIAFDGGEIFRNVEQDRLQILFDDKPDEDVRAALKSHGFRWSPRNSAWQRQLTDNAMIAAKAALGI